MPSASGLLAAVTSAVCNGTFGSLSKLPSVQRNRVPSPIFNLWVSLGIVVSSVPVLLFARQARMHIQVVRRKHAVVFQYPLKTARYYGICSSFAAPNSIITLLTPRLCCIPGIFYKLGPAEWCFVRDQHRQRLLCHQQNWSRCCNRDMVR